MMRWFSINMSPQKNTTKPSYISSAMNGKHKELVWQVHFLENDWILSKVEFYLSGEMGSCQQKCTFPSSEDDDCLLKVKWAPDNDDGYLNFHSVSGDGRVSNWTLVKVLNDHHLLYGDGNQNYHYAQLIIPSLGKDSNQATSLIVN